MTKLSKRVTFIYKRCSTRRSAIAVMIGLPHDWRFVKSSVTITIEVSTNSVTILCRMNLSGYVGHATIFS